MLSYTQSVSSSQLVRDHRPRLHNIVLYARKRFSASRSVHSMPTRNKVSSRFLRNSCSEQRMNNKTRHKSNSHGRRRNKAESQCSVRDAASGPHDTAMDDVQTARIDLTSAARARDGKISQPGPKTKVLLSLAEVPVIQAHYS